MSLTFMSGTPPEEVALHELKTLCETTNVNLPEPAAMHSDNNNPAVLTPPTAKEIAAAEAARLRRGFADAGGAGAGDISTNTSAPPPEEQNVPPKLPTGLPEPTAADVTYQTYEQLCDCVQTPTGQKRTRDDDGETYPTPAEAFEQTTTLMASTTWTDVVKGCNTLRRLAKFHPNATLPIITPAIPLLAKALKSPRSGIIKTAVMATADLCRVFKGSLLPHLESELLLQLLIKAGSNDKKFVIEEAQNALRNLAYSIAPDRNAGDALLILLETHAKHRNPKVRANAVLCMHALCAQRAHALSGDDSVALVAMAADGSSDEDDATVVRLSLPEDAQRTPSTPPPPLSLPQIKALLAVGGSQLTDKQKEARESARGLLEVLHSAFQSIPLGSQSPANAAVEADAVDEVSAAWTALCREVLEATTANAVLKTTQ